MAHVTDWMLTISKEEAASLSSCSSEQVLWILLSARIKPASRALVHLVPLQVFSNRDSLLDQMLQILGLFGARPYLDVRKEYR